MGGVFTEHGMHFLTARPTSPMRTVRLRPVAVLNIPTLALLGNAAPANAMDKSPTCPLRGPSMTARRFGQVKVLDGDDQTAVCKMCDHMQRAKTLCSVCLDRAGKMHMFNATTMARVGWGWGSGANINVETLVSMAVGLGEQLRALCH